MPPDSAATRKWAAEDDWERHKATITRLYETMTLAELKDHMESHHGLSATNKMYKTRFKRWGLWKYTRAADIPQILRARTEQRAAPEHAQKPTEVFLNGKRVDLEKVERYLRRRGSIRRQIEAGELFMQSHPDASLASALVTGRRRPPDLSSLRGSRRGSTPAISSGSSVSVATPISPLSPDPKFHHPGSPGVNLISSSSSSSAGSGSPAIYLTSPAPRTCSPVYLTPPASLRIPEQTYVAIRDYFDASFAAGRWISPSPTDLRIFLSTPSGELRDPARRVTEFHQRFRLAASRLLLAPAETGPEGMKLTRVCFAELPDVLAGEDPTLLYRVLDILRRLRSSRLEFLAAQLVRHLDGLTRRSGHPMAAVWRGMAALAALDEPGPGPGAEEHTGRLARIAAAQFGAHLGEHHIKTIEAQMWSMFLSDAGDDEKEASLRAIRAGLAAGGGFDYRNLTVTINLANHIRKRGQLDEAGDLIVAVLDDAANNAVLRGYPDVAYNYVSLLAKIRAAQGRLEEAEGLFRDAIGIAKANAADDDSDLLDGLVYLEKCLREQGKAAEADQVLAEREAMVRGDLERVGEQENAV